MPTKETYVYLVYADAIREQKGYEEIEAGQSLPLIVVPDLGGSIDFPVRPYDTDTNSELLSLVDTCTNLGQRDVLINQSKIVQRHTKNGSGVRITEDKKLSVFCLNELEEVEEEVTIDMQEGEFYLIGYAIPPQVQKVTQTAKKILQSSYISPAQFFNLTAVVFVRERTNPDEQPEELILDPLQEFITT